MELNFKTVKALSSPTRIRILNCILSKESTPTEISKKVDKSKSTVSNHLDTLIEADLIEKDKIEGRRRVIYRPTDKAEAIIAGKEKKVRFSIASSVISMFFGAIIFAYSGLSALGQLDDDTLSDAEPQEDEMDAFDVPDTPAEEAEADIGDQGLEAVLGEYLVPGVGGILVLTGLVLLSYGLWLRKLKRIEKED